MERDVGRQTYPQKGDGRGTEGSTELAGMRKGKKNNVRSAETCPKEGDNEGTEPGHRHKKTSRTEGASFREKEEYSRIT